MSGIDSTLLVAIALAMACGLLSIVVVLCRWAFIGEGISHSGFGGAGTAWLLMLYFPALDQPWMPYVAMTFFCLLTAVAIGALSRSRGMQADAAIGIFLVASLAWGFLCRHVFIQVRHAAPTLFDTLLFGEMQHFSPASAIGAMLVCLAAAMVVLAMWTQIVAYTFDPLLASSSGVRAGLVHYVLILVIAAVLVVGSRLVGSVLVTALLILPAATALRLSSKLNYVVGLSLAVANIGAVGGILLSRAKPILPPGPAIVLIMFLLFLISLGTSAFRRPVPA